MSGIDSGVERLSAWLVALPFLEPFGSAQARLTDRRVILVKVEGVGNVGWGEAAPVPGHSSQNVDRLWMQLAARIDAFGLAAITDTPGMLGAAFEQADADLRARDIGQPLWRILGGTRSVTASAAIGVADNGSPDPRQIETAAAAGYRHVKLKLTPAADPNQLAASQAQYPQIRFGVDGNGSIGPDHLALLTRLDDLDLEYIEQPGSRDDLDFHADLRQRLRTPISLDESASSPHRITQIISERSADVINLKVGRFGTTTTHRLAGDIVAGGLRARIGGLLETGVGRAHTLALAGHEFFSVAGDIAGSDRYFADDLVRPQWTVHAGQIDLMDSPGIGVEVDEDAVAAHSEESLNVG